MNVQQIINTTVLSTTDKRMATTLTGSVIGNLTQRNTYFRAVVQNSVCSLVNSSGILVTVNAAIPTYSCSSDQPRLRPRYGNCTQAVTGLWNYGTNWN
jgi:hypothetical protein